MLKGFIQVWRLEKSLAIGEHSLATFAVCTLCATMHHSPSIILSSPVTLNFNEFPESYYYYRLTDNANYIPSGFVDSVDNTGDILPGYWCKETGNDNGALVDLHRIAANRHGFDANKVREDFKTYFNSAEGALPWQSGHVQSVGQQFGQIKVGHVLLQYGSTLVLHHSFIDALLTVGVILQSKVCLQAFDKWSDLVQLIIAFVISLRHGSIIIQMQVPQDFLNPGS